VRRCGSAAVALLALSGCGSEPEPRAPTVASTLGEEPFREAASETGLDFDHVNGMSGEYYFNEMMGGGVALLDYDADGDLDVYLIQGHMLDPDETEAAAFDRLFRNDLGADPAGATTLRFTDVTAASGIRSDGYGMGVATGDYDNDGRIDLYVTNHGSNRLLRNTGNGTFEDATAASGTADPRWSVAATFFDFDRDGWLDLFVGNYVDFSLASNADCRTAGGAQTYCSPAAYPPEPDSLFRNLGDGTFEDVSGRAGLAGTAGAALGAVAADFDGDDLIDLYVANDGMPNRLWINEGSGSFRDEALLAGVALNQDGQPEASMGIAAGDFDGDGDIDIFLTHLEQETNTLYVNDGAGLFEDASIRSGLGPPSLAYTGFGAGWVDYDNDGWLDVMTVNGAVVDIESLKQSGDPYPLHQTNQLFRSLGDGRFQEVTAHAGDAFMLSDVSRGAAFGDLDNDGDTDVVVVSNNGPARLLLNQTGQRRAWLGVRAVAGNRDALGARVVVQQPDGSRLLRRVSTDGSYAAASDPRVLFGLGDGGPGSIDLEVRWPDGATETWNGVSSNAYTTLRRGEGRNE